MGKKGKLKKNKHKKNKSPFPKCENNLNNETPAIQNDRDENEFPNKEKPKKMLHKKKERKIKKIHKKNKKKSGGKKFVIEHCQYLDELDDFFMNEDLEKLPHDIFFTFNVPITMEENKEYIPLLISESDIILELLDARDIYHSKNNKIEQLINNNDKKLLIYVITKCDLVSEEYIGKIKKYLEEQNNNKNPVIVSSSLMREKIQSLFDELGTHIGLLKDKSNEQNKVIKIGIIGAPNVGKNSLIQSLELLVNSNCDEKYIYFNEEKYFCINSVPGITFDEDDNNNFLISKKYKDIKDIPDPLKLINNLLDVVDKNRLKDIYELNTIPESLDDFINLLKEKYEFEDNNVTICKILTDIVTGKISYEVNI